MKERPILFKGEMVLAILEGRKTQTRRVIKPQPIGPDHIRYAGTAIDGDHIILGDSSGSGLPIKNLASGSDGTFLPFAYRTCPYGVLGDRLWVRETWRPEIEDDTGFACINYCAKGSKAVGRNRILPYMNGTENWRPSIHMPRWASRIDLEITDVRVERVQEIWAGDVVHEGIFPNPGCGFSAETATMARHAFRDLWNSINAKRGYGWEENPWVWVIEFRVVEAR